MPAIRDDAAQILPGELNEITEDEAAEELLKSFLPPEKGKDASKPSSKKSDDDEQSNSDDDEDDEDSAEKPEHEDDDEDKEKTDEDDDEDDGQAEVTIKVMHNGKEEEVPVSKLARLYGQESALTKKSMDVAEQRRVYDTKLQEQVATTSAILERARARFEPYSKLDFNLLATQVTPDEYNALRQSAQTAYEDVQFLEHHAGAFMAKLHEGRAADVRTRAVAAIAELSGPADKGGIQGWNEKLYDDIRAFAISKGGNPDFINQTVDPYMIRLWYDAMLFARGRDKARVVTKKVNKRPTRIVKSSHSERSESSSSKSTAHVKRAQARFDMSGSPDDAAELMLAQLGAKSDRFD